jgi:signal transduction histidine kinase
VTEQLADHTDFVTEQISDVDDPTLVSSFDAVVASDTPSEQDGIEIFERLRSVGVRIPIILVGADDPDRLERALARGVTDYVTDADELPSRLRAHIRRPTRDGHVTEVRWESIIGVLAHDAKNPLNVVSGRLEFLDIEDTHAEAIGRSVRRVETLLDDVSAAGSLACPDDRTPTAIPALAREVWDDLDTESATLTIETDRTIDASSDAVKHILQRLFENSLAHADDGVTVTVGDTDDGIYITDDGPGLDEADPDRLFDQGYGTARDGEGYGLFVAKHIARSNGLLLTVADTDNIRFEIAYR